MVEPQVKIDKIDVKILKTLLKDVRTSFSDIAQDCGISTNAIVKRFYKLKQSGVISGTAIRLNMKKFEYKYSLAINMSVETDEMDHILEWFRKLPNIINCYQLVGKYDVHASVLVKSINDIHQVKDTLKMQKGVRKVCIAANLEEAGCFPENLVIQPVERKKNG